MEAQLVWLIGGLVIGYFIAQVTLFLFYDQIMDGMDNLYNWVQDKIRRQP